MFTTCYFCQSCYFNSKWVERHLLLLFVLLDIWIVGGSYLR